MTRWTWLLVGGLAVAAVPQEVAAAGYRKVKGCSHGEPVFVPRSCQREFARTTRELHLGLETEIAGVVQAMELSSSAEDLNVRLDQINSELQSHYVGICQTTSRDPCDRERLAELDEEMGHLRTLYADLRRVVSTSGEGDEWLLGELEQIQVAIRESDDLEDVLVTRRNPTVRLTGTWSVTSTPIPGACPQTSRGRCRASGESSRSRTRRSKSGWWMSRDRWPAATPTSPGTSRMDACGSPGRRTLARGLGLQSTFESTVIS